MTKYCGKCGAKLVWKQEEAEKHLNKLYIRFDKYDIETGKRQFVGWWECPKSRWWNRHDSYMPKIV